MTVLDMERIASLVREAGWCAFVEHTGAGVATIYASRTGISATQPAVDKDGYRDVACGPGWFAHGFTEPCADTAELFVGRTDDGATPPWRASRYSTEQDVANRIKALLQGKSTDVTSDTCKDLTGLNRPIDPELKNRLNGIAQRALSDAIALHGPITRDRTSSAAKRLVGQVLSHLHGTGHLKGTTATMADRTNTNEPPDFAHPNTTTGVDDRLRAFTQRLTSVLETELFNQSRELMGPDLLRDVELSVTGWSEPLAAQLAQQAADSLRDLLVRRVDLIIGYRDGHWAREHVYVTRHTRDAALDDAAVQRCTLEMENPLDVVFILPATDARNV